MYNKTIRVAKNCGTFTMRNACKIATAFAAASPMLAMADDSSGAAQSAIVASGATIAGYAGAAGAAGVAIMVVIYGIRAASRGLKAPK